MPERSVVLMAKEPGLVKTCPAGSSMNHADTGNLRRLPKDPSANRRSADMQATD